MSGTRHFVIFSYILENVFEESDESQNNRILLNQNEKEEYRISIPSSTSYQFASQYSELENQQNLVIAKLSKEEVDVLIKINGMRYRRKFIDFFYDYVHQIYMFEPICHSFIYNFFMALNCHENDSKKIQLFIKLLCGEDDVHWKYIHIVRILVKKFEKFDMESYRNCIRLLYPYRYVVNNLILAK
jgi:hypothetical protein